MPADVTQVCDELPPRTRSWVTEVFRCDSCGKLYWKGSHRERLVEWVNHATGLFNELEKLGASRTRLQIKLCGGARMFSIPGVQNPMDVGARNIAVATKVMTQEGVKSYKSDLGGSQGRTMSLFMDTGKVMVRTVGQGNVEL